MEKYRTNFTESDLMTINSVKFDTMNNTKRTNKMTYPDPEDGDYIVNLGKVELFYKNGIPKFNLEFVLLEGLDEITKRYIKSWPGKNHPKLPFRMSLAGTKADNRCIGYCIGLASKLNPAFDITFTGDFDKLEADLKALNDSVDDTFGYKITYDKESFRHIRINEFLRSADAEDVAMPESQPQVQEESFDDYYEDDEEMSEAQAYILAHQEPSAGASYEAEGETIAPDESGFVPLDDFGEEDELPF